MLWALLLLAAPSDVGWVSHWVKGEGPEPGLMKGWHDAFPASPHADGALGWEALQRTRQVAASGGKDAEALEATALRLLTDPKSEPRVKGRAAEVLGWLQAPRAIPALEKAARDGELRAAKALGFFGDRGAVDGFSVFGGQPAFAQFPPRPEPAALDALVGLMHDPHARVREAAVKQLELFDGPKVEEAWTGAAKSCDLPEALAWLEAHDVPGRLALLERCARAPDSTVRAAAVHALGAAGGRAEVPLLLAAIDDPADEVFLAAHRALSRLEGFAGEAPEASVKDRALLAPLWHRRLGPAPR